MKRMLSVFVLGLAGFAIANANEITSVELRATQSLQMNNEWVAQDTVKRTLVEPIDLPEAIHSTLRGDDYLGWTILSAYYVEPAEADSFYEITLQRVEEQELKVVKINAEGRVIE